MASSSNSENLAPVTLSSSLSLPRTSTKHLASKIENLVEYSYVPNPAQISESSMPLISPYKLSNLWWLVATQQIVAIMTWNGPPFKQVGCFHDFFLSYLKVAILIIICTSDNHLPPKKGSHALVAGQDELWLERQDSQSKTF